MIKKEHNSVSWFEYSLLKNHPEVRHAVFTRKGGSSAGNFRGLNLSEHVGDSVEHVRENREKAFQAIGLTVPIVEANQVHGASVETVREIATSRVDSCDGLVTNLKGVALSMQHADCQAALFYDPVHKAIASVHAGWRGNCQNIYKETIIKMGQEYGTRPEDLIVCISPSLGPNKAEFKNYQTELPEAFWRFKDENNYVNLWEIARWQLESEGVLPENIELAERCTYSDSELFYSYRRDRLCGRHLSLIWLE